MSTLVMVVGGSRGIGAAMCRTAPANSRVVCFSRTPGPKRATQVRVDLARRQDWDQMGAHFDDIVRGGSWNRTVLVHAAAVIDPIGFVDGLDAQSYANNVLVDAAAPLVVGQHYLRAVRRIPGRHQLCLLTSGAAAAVLPGLAAYGAAKAGLDHWVRTVGAEQRIRGGVEVCAVSPGMVDTPLQDRLGEVDPIDFPAVDVFRRARADGRMHAPAHVAVALWDLLDAGVMPGTVRDLWSM